MKQGDRIKALRLQKGLTTAELAEVVDVSQSTVSRWESGLIESVRSDKLIPLADALGTSVSYILGNVVSSSHPNWRQEYHKTIDGQIENVGVGGLTRAENELIFFIRDICVMDYFVKVGSDDYAKESDYNKTEANIRMVHDFIRSNANLLQVQFDAAHRDS